MTKNKRFIIDVGEPQHENAFFEYDEHFDDYDFVCWVDDFDEILKKFNELGNENEQLKKENEGLKFDIRYFETTYEIEESGLAIVPEMCTITSSAPTRKELFKENEQLKQQVKSKERLIEAYEQYINDLKEDGVLDD